MSTRFLPGRALRFRHGLWIIVENSTCSLSFRRSRWPAARRRCSVRNSVTAGLALIVLGTAMVAIAGASSRGHDAPETARLPSRPGEFHPESLTEPYVILSHHPARATKRRLPPSAEIAGSSRFDPVGPRSTTMTHPLRSMGITPLHRYYEAVRPSPAHRYFQPHGWSRLCFFP
jgi:hypothetical protein